MEPRYPGVYIAELPPGTRAITAASTSIAAFIGMSEKGPTNKAYPINSFIEFLDTFGGFTTKDALGIEDTRVPPDKNIYLPYAVWAFFQNGGTRCYIIRLATEAIPSSVKVTGEDGDDLDVVDQLTVGKSALDYISDVSLIAAPGFTSYEVINAGFTYAESHRNGLGDAFFIADVPATISNADEVKEFVTDPRFHPSNRGYGALYFPWINARDQLAKGQNAKVSLPPSGFIAGVYARIDSVGGVWKAPAGTEAGILGHQGLTVNLSNMDQGVINLAGVNALRTFPGYGTVVWGSRTASHEIEWRYVPVMRMANFLKSSIYDGIQWAVFEPNDEPLWNALRLTIGGFMMDLFRQQAFQSSTPQEAFFVKCDRETTTETDQQNGIVNILVGFAPLKPAEFLVVRLSQKVAKQQT